MVNLLVRFFPALCTYSILCTLEPPMGPTIYWSHFLIMKSEVALCRDNRQRDNNKFCLLYSTNWCSDPTPLISDGTVHVFLPDIDGLYSREPNLKCRASDVIASDGFSLCLIWSLPLVLRSIFAYDHCLWCQLHIIVQSELLPIARELIDIFFLILGLWSMSVIIACEVRLYAFGSEHTSCSLR